MPDRRRSPSTSLLRTVGPMSLATSTSRVLGLVREQVIAGYFGAGVVTDAFYIAFRIPNLLRDLFAEGALSSAFVPTFTATREREGPEAAWALANRVLTSLALVLGGITVLIFLFAPQILAVYGLGFDPAKRALAVTMTRILSPFLLCVGLAAVAMGMLNASGRFFMPALAPAWFNVCSILGVVTLVPVLSHAGIEPGLALAIGAIAGGAAQLLVQVPSLRRVGFRYRPAFGWRDAGQRRIRRLMLPAIFGLGATQLNIVVDSSLATLQGDGPVSYLQYAFRMIMLPIGVFGVAIGTANLARVSRDVARDDTAGLRRGLASALRMAAILTLPSTAGLIALREPVIALLFERGRFVAQDTVQTAAALLCYALGLFAYSATKIQVPTYYALDDTRRPVIASAVAVATKIGTSVLLIWWLPRIGVTAFLGLALSTSLAAWTNYVQLAVGLRRRLGSFAEFRVLRTTVVVAGVSAIMGVAVHLAYGASLTIAARGGTAVEAVRIGLLVVLGAALTALGLVVARVDESRAWIDRLTGGGDRA